MSPAGAFPAGLVCFRRQAVVFGVPLRAWAAHVVQVGPVRLFTAETSAQQPAEGFEKIVPHRKLHATHVAMRVEDAAFKRSWHG
jgi:hypothetical protein